MAYINNRFMFNNLLLIFMSFIITVQAASLDQRCDTNSLCVGTGLICRDEICQCDAPWYQPCNNACDIQRFFAYHGEECRVDDNCLYNTRCENSSKRCVCRDSFSELNGLCYKKYNETCVSDNDCWSNHCDTGLRRCTCSIGFELLHDGQCKRKLVQIHPNWEEANRTNNFCYDEYSCRTHLAICTTDGIHLDRFCQCPIGYTANFESQECEIIDFEELSPMNTHTSTDNATCLSCKDNYAVCAQVGSKSTCWCRAGYDKVDDRCQNTRYKFIFPNMMDTDMHSFSDNCSRVNSNLSTIDNLCSCADYQEYDILTQRCKNIEREWISEHFEYGICTRITSDQQAQVPNGALCPPPLQCRPNGDKYVCSCGQNRFLQSTLTTKRCVTRLGKPGESGSCPLNSDVINGTCQCNPGFKQVDEDRRCELVLESQETFTGCETNGPNGANDSCTKLFGGAARYCRAGVCRCSPSISYADPLLNICYGLLDVSQAETYCPPNSKSPKTTTCQCQDGYRKSNDSRRCEPKSLLYNWNEAVVHQPDLRREDCEILYGGLLAVFNDTATEKACRCDAIAFKYLNAGICAPMLYTNISRNFDQCYIPDARQSRKNLRQCECKSGFRPTSVLKRDCARIPARLDELIVISIPGVDQIDDADCRSLFGEISKMNNSRCICQENVSFANNDRTRCLAYINTPTGINTLAVSSCPQYGTIIENGKCECIRGFITSQGNRICVSADIPLVGSKIRNSASNCTNFNDDNCKVKYGNETFCENNQCWCNRGTSFKLNDNQCARFSNYTFPGLHERHNVSCDVDEDCTRDNVALETVECKKRTSPRDEYKVCVCKIGWFLNPSTQTCESRCPSDCNNRPNSQCNGYECVCKYGFHHENGTCVPNKNQIQLYKPCNSSSVTNENDPYTCTCARGQCQPTYKDEGFQCVRYNFDNDYCSSRGYGFCSNLIDNSECLSQENKCSCRSGYYRNNDACVPSVNSICTSSEQCGSDAICSGQRCRCGSGKRAKTIKDAWGRNIKRCVNSDDRIRFSLISSLFFLFIHLFFI